MYGRAGSTYECMEEQDQFLSNIMMFMRLSHLSEQDYQVKTHTIHKDVQIWTLQKNKY